MKASINGPNRRKNRAGNKTIASDFNATNSTTPGNVHSDESQCMIFKVKSLEKSLASFKLSNQKNGHHNSLPLDEDSIGDACVFVVKSDCDESTCSGQQLLHQHFQMSKFIYIIITDENRFQERYDVYSIIYNLHIPYSYYISLKP